MNQAQCNNRHISLYIYSYIAFFPLFRHNHGLCMLDKPRHDMIEPSSSNQILAGEKFTANAQCELVFGPESKVCSYMVSLVDGNVFFKM